MIVKKGDGYIVVSKKGKKLSKVYKTKEEAKKRLKQIEFFKHILKENNDNNGKPYIDPIILKGLKKYMDQNERNPNYKPKPPEKIDISEKNKNFKQLILNKLNFLETDKFLIIEKENNKLNNYNLSCKKDISTEDINFSIFINFSYTNDNDITTSATFQMTDHTIADLNLKSEKDLDKQEIYDQIQGDLEKISFRPIKTNIVNFKLSILPKIKKSTLKFYNIIKGTYDID
jgi:hypothetical protein